MLPGDERPRQPRVRALGMWYADDTGFHLQTATMKDLYLQLKADPRVELCFWKPGKPAAG